MLRIHTFFGYTSRQDAVEVHTNACSPTNNMSWSHKSPATVVALPEAKQSTTSSPALIRTFVTLFPTGLLDSIQPNCPITEVLEKLQPPIVHFLSCIARLLRVSGFPCGDYTTTDLIVDGLELDNRHRMSSHVTCLAEFVGDGAGSDRLVQIRSLTQRESMSNAARSCRIEWF